MYIYYAHIYEYPYYILYIYIHFMYIRSSHIIYACTYIYILLCMENVCKLVVWAFGFHYVHLYSYLLSWTGKIVKTKIDDLRTRADE